MLLIIKHNHKVYSKFYYRLFIIQWELLSKEILETYIRATDIAIAIEAIGLIMLYMLYMLLIQLLQTDK